MYIDQFFLEFFLINVEPIVKIFHINQTKCHTRKVYSAGSSEPNTAGQMSNTDMEVEYREQQSHLINYSKEDLNSLV